MNAVNYLSCRAENGVRTRDPQLGKLMLYQLSYFRKSCNNAFFQHANIKKSVEILSNRSTDFFMGRGSAHYCDAPSERRLFGESHRNRTVNSTLCIGRTSRYGSKVFAETFSRNSVGADTLCHKQFLDILGATARNLPIHGATT